MVKVKQQKITKRFAVYHGDSCKVIKGIPSDTVGLSVFSPPFSDLYSYSNDLEDMGNCRTRKDFFDHFRFLVPELFRVMMPGRVVAVHCMELPIFKRDSGYVGKWDFPGAIIRCFGKEGFIFTSRFCIWKDPLIAALRTRSIQLAHKQLVKDSSISAPAGADYILTFRKPGECPSPISHDRGLTEYHGAMEVPRNLDHYKGEKIQKKNKRSHWIWRRYASPVWDDIRQTKVLEFKQGREKDDQKHICPLQRDVVERCLQLWSNPGDTVLTPFMGIGTEVYVAVKNGRRGVGIELKATYYRQALRHIQSIRE